LSSGADFVDVTEIGGSPISGELFQRLVNRYSWAQSVCAGCDVVELACGTGPGLGILASASKSFEAGDYSVPILEFARGHYGNRIPLLRLNAEELPFDAASRDVIILFEALYYLREPERFLKECVRVLRPNGTVLISTANKDLWDFHPSPHAHEYFGVLELRALFARYGFECEFFGFQPIDKSPLRQRVLRPLKRLAVDLAIMPKTMRGKRWLKRVVFGAEVTMPAELVAADVSSYRSPTAIDAAAPDRLHKVIYCAARRRAVT
jgi:SAM-dependent methyltransferase